MPERTAPVEPAADALARYRARLAELMQQRGVTSRDELLDTFRGMDRQLVEDEAFHEADHVLGLVASLEELTQG